MSGFKPPGTLVFARMRGYPPWPARVAKHSEASREVHALKKAGAVLIYFFGTHDFSWMSPSNLAEWSEGPLPQQKTLPKEDARSLERAQQEAKRWLKVPPSKRAFIVLEQSDDDEDDSGDSEAKSLWSDDADMKKRKRDNLPQPTAEPEGPERAVEAKLVRERQRKRSQSIGKRRVAAAAAAAPRNSAQSDQDAQVILERKRVKKRSKSIENPYDTTAAAAPRDATLHAPHAQDVSMGTNRREQKRPRKGEQPSAATTEKTMVRKGPNPVPSRSPARSISAESREPRSHQERSVVDELAAASLGLVGTERGEDVRRRTLAEGHSRGSGGDRRRSPSQKNRREREAADAAASANNAGHAVAGVVASSKRRAKSSVDATAPSKRRAGSDDLDAPRRIKMDAGQREARLHSSGGQPHAGGQLDHKKSSRDPLHLREPRGSQHRGALREQQRRGETKMSVAPPSRDKSNSADSPTPARASGTDVTRDRNASGGGSTQQLLNDIWDANTGMVDTLKRQMDALMRSHLLEVEAAVDKRVQKAVDTALASRDHGRGAAVNREHVELASANLTTTEKCLSIVLTGRTWEEEEKMTLQHAADACKKAQSALGNLRW